MLPDHELKRLEVVAESEQHLKTLIEARLSGTPLQYLEGTAPFGPYEIDVDGRVLVPRPETEQLWELAVRSTHAPDVVVDMCTGSGALAIALAGSFSESRVVATDLSPDALAVAASNVHRLAPRVELLEGDLFEALPKALIGKVDLLVSNPPYVARGEWDRLPEDVRREPAMALVAGPMGTELLERLITEAAVWLSSDGVVVCEIGETQGDALLAFSGKSLAWSRIEADLTGRPRFLVGGLGQP